MMYRDVETAVEVGGLTPNSDPILIIGAGLSAADAIITAQVNHHSCPPGLVLSRLSVP